MKAPQPWRGSVWQSLDPVSPPVVIQEGAAVHGTGQFLYKCRVVPITYKPRLTKKQKQLLESAKAMAEVGTIISNILYNVEQMNLSSLSMNDMANIRRTMDQYRKKWDAIPNKRLAQQELERHSRASHSR